MELIGCGREADVYALDEFRVLRRYRDGGDAEAEAAVMAHVGGLGFPVPRVFDVSGADMILERLDGPTMVAALGDGRITVDDGAAILAGLHDLLHRLPTRSGRRDGNQSGSPQDGEQGTLQDGDQGARQDGDRGIRQDGDQGARQDGDRGIRQDGDYAARREADRVLHRDLHPDNVMLTSRGPVVIDWRNAAEGRPAVDVCLTAIILAQVAADSGHPSTAVAAEFLTAYLRLTGATVWSGFDEAIEIRRADPALTPAESAALAATVGPLIRAASVG